MTFDIGPNTVWFHGSDRRFAVLREGSTITPWRALAAAFSHRPSRLSYGEDGVIEHNGDRVGWLYVVDEPLRPNEDMRQHPRTTMDAGAEWLTTRPLRLRLVEGPLAVNSKTR